MTIVSSDGSTSVNERRLLQTSDVIQPKTSGATERTAALANIQQNPINSQMPSIDFNVDVPKTLSQIYGVRPEQEWAFVNLHLTLQTPLTDVALVRTAVATILQVNFFLLFFLLCVIDTN